MTISPVAKFSRVILFCLDKTIWNEKYFYKQKWRKYKSI